MYGLYDINNIMTGVFQEVGACSIQGSRPDMQDSFFLSEAEGIIGVFDGHNERGAMAAKLACLAFAACAQEFDEGFRDLFVQTDKQLEGINGGTTATLVAVQQTKDAKRIRTAWVGDSPAYRISVADAYTDSYDLFRLPDRFGHMNYGAHNADNQPEVERLLDLNYRQYGRSFLNPSWTLSISVSRALGSQTPDGGISAEPHESVFELKVPTETAELLVVGSDGVLTPSTAQEAFHTIAEQVRRGKTLQAIAEMVTCQCARQTEDNATLVIASL
jgi:serine/threonine protein phosphatase PrpC